MLPNYKAAFNILMDYWEFIPENERKIVDQKLRIALNEPNSPYTTLSNANYNPPKDCIKKTLNRLKDEMNFGIPDKEIE